MKCLMNIISNVLIEYEMFYEQNIEMLYKNNINKCCRRNVVRFLSVVLCLMDRNVIYGYKWSLGH